MRNNKIAQAAIVDPGQGIISQSAYVLLGSESLSGAGWPWPNLSVDLGHSYRFEIAMPRDYTDQKLRFPRLEARRQQIRANAVWVQIWFREKPGHDRVQVINEQHTGSSDDAKALVREYARKWGADVGPDDITVD